MDLDSYKIIKEDLEKLIEKYTSDYCMCGHFEFCDKCDPESIQNKIRNYYKEVLETLKNKIIEGL